MEEAERDPDRPWVGSDPSRKTHLNIPIPEPLNLQMEYLLEHKAIRSKASFIREAVEKAAEAEIQRLWMVREAVRQMEKGNRPAKG